MTAIFKINKRGDIKVIEPVEQDVEKLSSFQSWLIRQRRYCEFRSCMRQAVTVKDVNGRETVLCGFHTGKADE